MFQKNQMVLISGPQYRTHKLSTNIGHQLNVEQWRHLRIHELVKYQISGKEI